ncbi:MAG: chloride channel protein [Betaproteobacteria bacterium]|nr:chloride channel protein [Betaproteobacteria bacterium]
MTFMLIALILGAVTGGIIWLFLKAVEAGIVLLWEIFPARMGFDAYPIVVCAAGGVIIGLWRRKFGNYPEELQDVMATVKETRRYDSRNICVLLAAAFLPLVFGGSVGPEAGLAGIIAALCTWMGDRFKYVLKEMKELAETGVSASLSILFTAPLFGFMAQIEGEGENISFPNRIKVIVYFCAMLSGLGVLISLTSAFGGGLSVERFDQAIISRHEIIWFLPLALFAAAAGCLYHLLDRLVRFAANPLQRYPVISSLLGGLLLGLCGMFIPLLMFSGESQMGDIMASWKSMTPVFLFALGFFKLLMINVCMHTGWRGGHILPVVFSGVCFGYGLAALTGVNSAFAVAIVTTALCSAVMGKPIAVIMIMLIFFPAKDIIALSLAALLGACAPFVSSLLKRQSAGLDILRSVADNGESCKEDDRCGQAGG